MTHDTDDLIGAMALLYESGAVTGAGLRNMMYGMLSLEQAASDDTATGAERARQLAADHDDEQVLPLPETDAPAQLFEDDDGDSDREPTRLELDNGNTVDADTEQLDATGGEPPLVAVDHPTRRVEDTDDRPSGDELASQAAKDVSALLSDSRDTHGDAVENQEHIAAGWTWYLRGLGYLDEDESLDGRDVGRMMPLVKMSRAATGDEDIDHDRDISGYASIAQACAVADPDTDVTVEDLHEYRQGQGEYA